MFFKEIHIVDLETFFYQLLKDDDDNATEKIDSYSFKRLAFNSSITLANKKVWFENCKVSSQALKELFCIVSC